MDNGISFVFVVRWQDSGGYRSVEVEAPGADAAREAAGAPASASVECLGYA